MIRAAIKFARIRIIATCFALVFVGSAAGGQVTAMTFLALLLIVAFTIHANSINDYADREIDAINLGDAADRPLVSQDVTAQQFWTIHFMSAALMLGLSLFYGLPGFLLTLGILFVDYAYSLKPLRITDRTFASPLLLAAAYTFYAVTLGYWSAGSAHTYPWLLTIGLCLGFVARLLLKDFRDVKGDKKHGKVTFLLRYGASATTLVSGICWIAAMITLAIAVDFAYGLVVPLTLGSIMVCIWLVRLSSARDDSRQQMLIAFIAKAANIAIITVLTYLLVSQQPDASAAEVIYIPLATGTALLLFNWLHYTNARKNSHVRPIS